MNRKAMSKKKIPILDNKQLLMKILDLEKRVAALERRIKKCPKAKAKRRRGKSKLKALKQKVHKHKVEGTTR